MHDAIVRMKDGREFCGPIWEFNPRDGYLTIPMDCDERLYFRDIESAVQTGQRTHPGVVEDVDLLAKARKEGWDGT